MNPIMDAIVTTPLNRTLLIVLLLEVTVIGIVTIVLLSLIRRKVNQIMAELDDLKSALADQAAAIKRETDDVGKVLDQMTGVIHPSDLKDLVAQVRASNATINDAATKMETALNPPPAPAGTPPAAETPGTPPTGAPASEAGTAPPETGTEATSPPAETVPGG